jgi:hypothetical protein
MRWISRSLLAISVHAGAAEAVVFRDAYLCPIAGSDAPRAHTARAATDDEEVEVRL